MMNRQTGLSRVGSAIVRPLASSGIVRLQADFDFRQESYRHRGTPAQESGNPLVAGSGDARKQG